jgi:hypothetical protein
VFSYTCFYAILGIGLISHFFCYMRGCTPTSTEPILSKYYQLYILIDTISNYHLGAQAISSHSGNSPSTLLCIALTKEKSSNVVRL